MIRVVHLFNVKPGIEEQSFIEWLDARISEKTRQFGCVERKIWILLDGFEGSYLHPRPVKGRPKYVNEAYWRDQDGPAEFRNWLLNTEEGRECHDRWFGSITDHTILRYVEGWIPAVVGED